MKVTVLDNILKANDVIAEEIQAELDSNKVLAINIMSSPGSGKTTLLERTCERFKEEGIRVGIIEGDIETTRDADRLERFNIPIVQINTGSACHLDANMIRGAMSNMDTTAVDMIFIENVGNLVCPAEFKVGEDHKVMLLSVTEGDEKPLKYPLMFRESSSMIINKIDLLEHTNFSMDEAKKNALKINPQLNIFPISCTNSEGLDAWIEWLKKELEAKRAGSR